MSTELLYLYTLVNIQGGDIRIRYLLPLPKILFNLYLLLSPYVFLLSILFQYRAFQVPNLTSLQKLGYLNIYPRELESSLLLKNELDKIYTFYRAIQDLTSIQLSLNEPISYMIIAIQIRKTRDIFEVEFPTILYSLQHNTTNIFDRSSPSRPPSPLEPY